MTKCLPIGEVVLVRATFRNLFQLCQMFLKGIRSVKISESGRCELENFRQNDRLIAKFVLLAN